MAKYLSMGRADSEQSDNPPMPNNVKFPDMPPNKKPMFGNVGMNVSMVGFVYGGLPRKRRIHLTIHPSYGRTIDPSYGRFCPPICLANGGQTIKFGRVGRFFCPPFSGGCGVPCSHRRECRSFRVVTNSMCPPFASPIYSAWAEKRCPPYLTSFMVDCRASGESTLQFIRRTVVSHVITAGSLDEV